MIEVSGLTKVYGTTPVLRDVSFTLADGESLALWGPNGAGKTTVLRCALGLTRYEGTIEVDGLDATTHGKAVRRRIGHVPQELAFFHDLSAIETLDLCAKIRRVDVSRGDEALERVGLADAAGKAVGALSGGMKQRLGIAIALLEDAPLLLMDEPTSSLDVAARESVLELLAGLRDQGRSMLLTTHRLEEVGMLVDRVLGMEDGCVTTECAPSELAEQLGLRSWLHLVLAEEELEPALEALRGRGFTAHRNTKGILVEVSAQHKAETFAVLHETGLEPLDFEVWR
ncbi:MAG: ABC transporter ATP-binding protein [Acidimicrobiia bacterium]